ncbi:MAG: cytochrome c [Ignavibacteria bacterium]|nr:cytochrome c [Ignavibacteria bacterium]
MWPKKCAKCHGKDGKGKLEGVPDLTGETKGKSVNQLKQIIENGKKGKTDDDEDMPSFKGKLTDEEIDAAAKYVKGL